MNQKFNEIIKSIFDRALELDNLSRELFFKNLTDEEKPYEDEVKSLLKAFDVNNDFLEIENDRNIFSDDNIGPHPLIGQHIGPYLIESEIGIGGTGIVFSGKRDDKEFEQKVAIKILKQGLTSEYLVKRFQNERQTLANLQHPNIAKLFDGGKTSEGLPFLIMEYIDGMPITEYCEENKLSIENRLKLFITVCQAVQYAHQNLIIHRDIKPGNILVNKQGIPKLLDFGIAKLLDQEISNEKDALTKTGMWHLTPEYASPEQIKGTNITTSSDIYSLGILLYQILSGNIPYKIYNTSPLAISKILDEGKIAKPSEILEKDTKEFENNSNISQTFKSILYKQLKGDLDNIVLKAMHKDPSQRYSSVQEFSNDIERYLKGLTVIARPDTYTYRFSKFVKRHKVGAVLFVLFNLIIFASIVAIFFQGQIAAKERDKANLEAAKTESVNNFLLEMISSPDPTEEGKEIKVIDVLKKASKEVGTNFKDHPGIEAAVRQTLGKTFTNLGEYDQAKLHLEKSLELNEKVYGNNSYQSGGSIHELALFYDWYGDLNKSDSLYNKSIKIFREDKYTPKRVLANALNDYGIIKQEQDKYPESLVLIKEGYQIAVKNFGEKDRDIASIANNLGVSFDGTNEIDSAKIYYKKSLDLYLELYGSERPEVSTIYNNLAYIYINEEDYETAHEYFSKSLELKQKTWGENHSMVGLALMNLGALEFMMKLFDQSKTNLKKSIVNFKTSVNENHIWLGLSYYWYAKDLIEDLKPVEAESYLNKALKIFYKNYPPEHVNIISANADLGIALFLQKKYSGVEKLLVDGYENIKKLKGESNFNTLRVLEYIVKYYKENKNPEKENLYSNILISGRNSK